MNVMMTWNPSMDSKNAPSVSPMETIPMARSNAIPRPPTNPRGATPTRTTPRSSRMKAVIIASVAPPSTFPKNTVIREMGATRISFSTSIFRSHTI